MMPMLYSINYSAQCIHTCSVVLVNRPQNPTTCACVKSYIRTLYISYFQWQGEHALELKYIRIENAP